MECVMAFLKPDTLQIPVPKQPDAAPPVFSPQGSKPGAKSQRTSFLGSEATPQMNSGGNMAKTLLGQ